MLFFFFIYCGLVGEDEEPAAANGFKCANGDV